MNAIVKHEGALPPALLIDERQLLDVMRNSLYPGAKDESIKLVLGYCKASGLDPMLKPVHIVPMKVPTGKKDSKGWDIKEERDVVMPGIGLYRVQAEQSGQHAGTSEPEFGPDVQGEVGAAKIKYPEWCRVTVTKIVDGKEREFVAKELWLENYASKGDGSPNAMWAKRPYAQLAKCAEAQALRKAFPSRAGSQATAEEMEGKTFDEAGSIPGESTRIVEPLPAYSDEKITANLTKWHEQIRKAVTAGKSVEEAAEAKLNQIRSAFTLTDDQVKRIKTLPAEEKAVIEGEAKQVTESQPAAKTGPQTTEDELLGGK